MANYCNTTLTITDSYDKIEKIKNQMMIAMDKNTNKHIKENAHKSYDWTGWLKIYEDESTPLDSIQDRDEIYAIKSKYITDEKSELIIKVSSAWKPYLRVIRNFVNNISDKAEIKYLAQEFGCGIFLTNDKSVIRNNTLIIAHNISDFMSKNIFNAHKNQYPLLHNIISRNYDEITIYGITADEIAQIENEIEDTDRYDETNYEYMLDDEIYRLTKEFEDVYVNVYEYTYCHIEDL